MPEKSSAVVSTEAPAMISMISAVLFTVPSNASRNIVHDNTRLLAASITAPATPIAADSVGVANPA
jgi:hypothetical protein